ncbi:hypothetical protein NZE47_004824, partial [Salmonella enterica]|nr:hypothetical protein [Salmonella enterica]
AGNFETEHQRTLIREVCAAVQTGRLVVVSGLVGSGKTHLLRRIEAELTYRLVNAIPDDKGHCPERTADGCMAA